MIHVLASIHVKEGKRAQALAAIHGNLAAVRAEAGCIHIIGTTGLDADQEQALALAGQKTPIMYAPNMSLAVNILFALTRQVSEILDEDFDIEILERHHRYKVDAPSGTALGLGRAAAAGRVPRLQRLARIGVGIDTRRRGGRRHGFLRN